MTDGAQIASKAREGVTASWTTDLLGYCSMFVRQVLQKAGVKDDLFGGTAIATAQKFRAAGLVSNDTSNLRPGDVLFQEFGSWIDTNGDGKKDTQAGHTGVFIGNGQVAQNGFNGKQIIPLAAFGKITGVGRVDLGPDPYGTYASGKLPTPLTGGAARTHAVTTGQTGADSRAANIPFGVQAANRWKEFTDQFSVGNQVSGAVSDFFSNVWAAVAPYLASMGLMAVALLLLLLGSWAAIQGGK